MTALTAFKAWCKADSAETEAWKRLHRAEASAASDEIYAKRYAEWEAAFAARKTADQTYKEKSNGQV